MARRFNQFLNVLAILGWLGLLWFIIKFVI